MSVQDGFPLVGLPSLLLERILPKVREKEYYRLQQTCKSMQELFRTNRKIQICSNRRWIFEVGNTPWGKELKRGRHLLRYLWGVRYKAVMIPEKFPEPANKFVKDLCALLQLHRITAEQLSLHYKKSYDAFSKSDLLTMLAVLKPVKVSLRSYGSDKYEVLLQKHEIKNIKLCLDPVDVPRAVDLFFPNTPSLTLRSVGAQEKMLDLAVKILECIESIPRMPKKFDLKFIGRCDTVVDLPVSEITLALRQFLPEGRSFYGQRNTRFGCSLHHYSQCEIIVDRTSFHLQFKNIETDALLVR